MITLSPKAGAANVRDALFDAFKILREFPLAGRRQTIPKVRKLITRKYSYLIYYTVDEEAGDVVVLTIQHPARARPFEDK